MIKNIMKKVLLFFGCMLLFSSYVNAQVPQGIPYQAVARNGQGQPLANTNVKVRFSILDSTATGTAVFVESHSTTTSALGLFTANVGMGTASTGTFSAINWGQNYKFLKVELDTTATGNSYIDLGTQQMMSVPYALYAGNLSHNVYSLNNHGSILFSSSGEYNWIVPINSGFIEINFNGSVGGNGGFACTYEGSCWQGGGGAGGTFGSARVIIPVSINDTILIHIGQNGQNGADFIRPQACGLCTGSGGTGAQGELSTIKINGIDVFSIVGGNGGTGGSFSNLGQRPGVNGVNGYLDVNSTINSNCNVLALSSLYLNNSNQCLIKF
jgi:hypothetical protein